MTITGKLIIIGCGIAGLSAARAARRQYPHIDITLISNEPSGFYNRIALGAFVSGKRNEAELHTFAAHLYVHERINTRFSTQVDRIITAQKQIQFSDGSTLPFDKLILATGASPVLPPVDGMQHNGVFTMWTLNDAQRLKPAVEAASEITVIGGGVLGIEAAMDFASQGKKVHLVESASSILGNMLSTESAESIMSLLRGKGIAVSTGDIATKIETTNNRLRTTLKKQTIESDLVFVSIGVRPNVQLAEQAHLKVNNGIIVDDTLHTGDPHILACGNCVVQPPGGALLWNPAKEQGAIAGKNAFKSHVTVQMRPAPVHLKSDWLPLFALGNPNAASTKSICIRDGGSNDAVERLIHLSADGKLQYAMLRGDTTGYYELEKYFRNDIPLPPECRNAQRVTDVLAGLTPPSDESPFTKSSWTCDVCGYTHEGDQPPHICPVCSVGKDQFLAA